MQMPYTTKDELRSTPYRNGLQVHESRVVRYHSSSGSTGSPTVMAYTQADLNLLGKLTARAFQPLRTRVSHWRVYNAFGYGLFTGGLSFEEAARHARRHMNIPMGVIPASNQPGVAFEAAMAQHRRSIELFEPTILCCTPSLAFALWEEGLLDGFEAIITGGEPSSAGLRKILEGRGERTVIEARYIDGGQCADTVLLVTVSDDDNKVYQDHYPVKAPTEWSWTVWYKVPVIRTTTSI